MIKIYCYDRCSTCKKALSWLDNKDIKYEKIDIKNNNPDEKTLRELHKKSGLPLKKFFNTSGILYREQQISEKLSSMTEDEQLKLLSTDGMLVKRPLLICDNGVIPGFKEESWRKVLGL